jgi:phage tail sheath protein FI
METFHPGIYVQEQDEIPTLSGIGSSVAAFVGVAEKGPVNKLRLITSLKDFTSTFGGPLKMSGSYVYLYFAVQGFFSNGGQACYVVRVSPTR